MAEPRTLLRGCAQVMRHILIDHARAHARDKRGGGAIQVSLNEAAVIGRRTGVEHFLALDEALRRSNRSIRRKARSSSCVISVV
jgi:hypothetical protein